MACSKNQSSENAQENPGVPVNKEEYVARVTSKTQSSWLTFIITEAKPNVKPNTCQGLKSVDKVARLS